MEKTEKLPIIEQIKDSMGNFWKPLDEKNEEFGINYQVVGLCAAMIVGAYIIRKALTPVPSCYTVKSVY